MKKLCVVSMSGGLDSTTLAYKAIADGFTVLPININYQQKNKVEQLAFQDIYQHIQEDSPDKILPPVELRLDQFLKEPLLKYKNLRDSKRVQEATDMEFYTPSRNLLFSVLAAMIGEIIALDEKLTEVRIGLGVHKHTQYDRDYWDISPEFVQKLNEVFALNDCMKVEMYAPYANSTKAEIVKDALALKVPIFSTWTCYNPQRDIIDTDARSNKQFVEYLPCLECEACVERQKAGDEADCPNINNYVIEKWESTSFKPGGL